MSLSNDKALKSVAEAVSKIMEAEKKAKMDYDKDGKVESPKDEVWGSRFRAAKMAGKMKEEAQPSEEQIDEASYSAKAARAGKDIGKPGKEFGKIAKSAGKRYGSAEAGKRVAGAILAKLRKEETEEQLEEGKWPDFDAERKKKEAPKPSGGSGMKQGSRYGGGKQAPDDDNDADDMPKAKKGYGARQNYTRSKRVNESLSFTEMLELYNEEGLKVLAPIEKEEIEVEGNTIEVIDADKINGVVDTVVEEADEKEFNDNLEKNKAKAAGTAKQPDLAKGDVQAVKNEEAELDERTLTAGETKKKEHYVKSMKKGLSGFKARYGDRAKEVMYATATKMAKKD